MKDDSNVNIQHKDLNPAEISKSEININACLSAFGGFMNPFTIEDHAALYSISSGAKVPEAIEKDVLQAEKHGKSQKEKFIEERLKENDKFFEPIKKLNLKTMASNTKSVKIKSSQNKVIELKHQGNIAFQLLVMSQNTSLALNEVMSYQLTPIPYSLGTPDGFLNKNNKALGLKTLTSDIDDSKQPPQDKTLMIVDGNAMYHSLVEIPDTLKGVCEKIYSLIPGFSDVIFSTDMYEPESIKSSERKRRGSGERLLIKGPAMKRPADWKGFLANDENKKQFTDVLLRVWSDDSFAGRLKDRKVVMNVYNIL